MTELGWHLGGRDFFWGLPAEKQDFIARAKLRVIKKHALVFREQDRGDSAFYLEQGEVRIFRISPLGKESIVFIRHAGEMFGLAEVMGGERRLCSAQAITACRLHEIGKGAFEDLLKSHYSLSKRVIEVLGKRLRYLGEQVESLMACDVTDRLLKLLVYLGCDRLVDQPSLDAPLTIAVKLTQEQIAAMIGSCQQTVSETLKKLRDDGLIEIRQREIVILRPRQILGQIFS